MRLQRRLRNFFGSKPDQIQPFRPVILVTGCASGIGLAIAYRLRRLHRYRVVVTARNKSIEDLRQIFEETERFWIRSLDVTDAANRECLIEEINEKWGGVNVLVNNAGISYRSVLEHMTDEDEMHQMQVNYFGPMALIRLVLPNMRARGRGKVISISSVSGMVAMPTMGSYSASKYALEGASEALWYEAKPYGIDVTLIQPGFIHSNSFQNVYYTKKSHPSALADGPYSDYYKNMTPFIEKMMKFSPTTPKMIGKLVVKVIQTEDPPLWIPGTWDAVIFYYIRRIFPRRLLLPFLFRCLPNARHWAERHTNKRII